MLRRHAMAALVLALAAGTALAQNNQGTSQPRTNPPKAGQPGATPPAAGDVKNVKEKASYAFGMNVGRSIKGQDLDLDTEIFIRGLKDALGGKEPAYTPQEMQTAIQQFMQQAQAKAEAEMKEQAAAGLKAAQQFLEQNKKKEGVTTTKSGLQYQILKEGSGKSPDANDIVKVHYKGTLTDGTEFDSSYARNEPAEFPLNRVIPGWSEAVRLLKAGGKGKFWIPPDLGYGTSPPPGSPIGVNDVLVFEIELLGVTEQPNAPAAGTPQGAPRPQPRSNNQ